MVIVPICVFLLVASITVSGQFSGDGEFEMMSATASVQVQPTAREKWEALKNASERLAVGITHKITLAATYRFVSGGSGMSSACTTDLIAMMKGIKQLKVWAFKMLDAFGKIPSGFLSGTSTAFGDFDGCLEVAVGDKFQGKYCMVEVYPPGLDENFNRPEHFLNFSEPDTIITQVLFMIAASPEPVKMRSAVCLPSTCTREDVENVLNKWLTGSKLGFKVKVPYCEVNEQPRFDGAEIFAMCAVGIVVLLVLIGTAVDVFFMVTAENREDRFCTRAFPGMLLRALLCFSFYSNTVRLLKKDTSPDSIKTFHGLRIVAFLWMLLCHTYIIFNEQLRGDLVNVPKIATERAFQLVANGFFSVETFFYISGVLVIYIRMKIKDEGFSAPYYVLLRYLRLTPAFLFLSLSIFFLYRVGSGPEWNNILGNMSTACKNYWWRNVLYINNYGDSSKWCAYWSWYLSADMHLHILALLVLIPIKRYPRVGLGMLAFTLVMSIAVVIVVNASYGLPATHTAYFALPRDKSTFFFEVGYLGTHQHGIPFTVGMVVGYILSTRQTLCLSFRVKLLGWSVSVAAALTVIYMVHGWHAAYFAMSDNIPSLASSVLYSCLDKVVWCSALGWITICCFFRHGGFVSSVLSWSAFVPLARLTYSAYLVHLLIHLMYTASARALIPFTHRTVIYMYLALLVADYSAAYVFCMLFESPFSALQSLIFSKRRKENGTHTADQFAKQPTEPTKGADMDTELQEACFTGNTHNSSPTGKEARTYF